MVETVYKLAGYVPALFSEIEEGDCNLLTYSLLRLCHSQSSDVYLVTFENAMEMLMLVEKCSPNERPLADSNRVLQRLPSRPVDGLAELLKSERKKV